MRSFFKYLLKMLPILFAANLLKSTLSKKILNYRLSQLSIELIDSHEDFLIWPRFYRRGDRKGILNIIFLEPSI
jgi:hypothetical protein